MLSHGFFTPLFLTFTSVLANGVKGNGLMKEVEKQKGWKDELGRRTRGVAVWIWKSVPLFPLLYFGSKVSLSRSLSLPASLSLLCLTLPSIHQHTYLHTRTHQSIQACLALPKPKMTIDFMTTLPLNYANLYFMFWYFFLASLHKMGRWFTLRQGWSERGVESRIQPSVFHTIVS